MKFIVFLLSIVLGFEGNIGGVENKKDIHWSDEERDHHRFERRLAGLNSVIAFLGAIATASAAVFAYNAYLEAKRQANVAQRALEVSLRPWVYIEKLDLSVPISVIDGKIDLAVQANVKNYSQLPANSIMFFAEFTGYGSGFNNIEKEARDFCYKQKGVNFRFGNILPSSETADTNIVNGVIDISKSASLFIDTDKERAIKIVIKGCLNYNGPDGAPHQTIVGYQLFDTDNFYLKIKNGLIPRNSIQFHLLFMHEGG